MFQALISSHNSIAKLMKWRLPLYYCHYTLIDCIINMNCIFFPWNWKILISFSIKSKRNKNCILFYFLGLLFLAGLIWRDRMPKLQGSKSVSKHLPSTQKFDMLKKNALVSQNNSKRNLISVVLKSCQSRWFNLEGKNVNVRKEGKALSSYSNMDYVVIVLDRILIL